MTGAGRQGDSFGRVADAYARSRPPYPPAVFTDLVDRSPIDAPRALDVAAGTGVATRGLLAAGASVVAVEPDLAMLRRARTDPGDRSRFIGAIAGRAEALPVADDAVDLLVAAQAFHWFEARGALDEFARVLSPGGVLALVWNMVEPNAFVGAVRAMIRRRIDDLEIPVTVAMTDPPESLVDHPAFDLGGSREIPHEREMDADRYVTYAFSWSYCGGALTPAERDPVERELRALIDRHHGTAAWRERLVAVLHTAVRRA